MLNKSRRTRLLWIIGLLVAVSGTVYSVLRVFNDNLVLFYTPTQIKESPPRGAPTDSGAWSRRAASYARVTV